MTNGTVGNISTWRQIFGDVVVVEHLLPFSVRMGFGWDDISRLREEVARRLPPDFTISIADFQSLGLVHLPESYRRRFFGWVRIELPPGFLEAMDGRRREILAMRGSEDGRCPSATENSMTGEILLATTGLGVVRVTNEVRWDSCSELERLHSSQAVFIESYFKRYRSRPDRPDDVLAVLEQLRRAIETLPRSRADARARLTAHDRGVFQPIDYFISLVVCQAPTETAGRQCMQLIDAEEIAAITHRPRPYGPGCLMAADMLVVASWDTSLLAAAGPPAVLAREVTNIRLLFVLASMHWTGLYDIDQLLYSATDFLFAQGRAPFKLGLIRGVQRQMAQLLHESKISYLAEHAEDQRVLRQIFECWETENLVHNLEKKSEMLSTIVGRLNSERLNGLVMFFTFFSVAGLISGLGQILYAPKLTVHALDVAWLVGSALTGVGLWCAYILWSRR
jgi:hypothetical protein